jgi:hypothetical protein
MRRPAGAGLGPAALVLIVTPQLYGQDARLECRDRHARLVRVQSDRRIPYPAYATLDGDGLPVIYWNPKATASRSAIWRRFVLLHECGHVLLRHLERPPGTVADRRRSEMEADCFAIQTLHESPATSGRDLSRLLAELSRSRGDVAHQGGQSLMLALEECLEAPTNGRRWRTALDQLMAASADSFSSITGPWLGRTWAGDIREATMDLPGTFDCEIRPPGSFVCLLMAAENEKPARRRFEDIRRILQGWLPPDWTQADRETTTSLAELFLAQSGNDGTFLALVRTTGDRVYFVARPADR